jgi:hypothetical protein
MEGLAKGKRGPYTVADKNRRYARVLKIDSE